MSLGMKIPTYTHDFLLLSSPLQTWESARRQVLYKRWMGLSSFGPRKTSEAGTNMRTCRLARVAGGLPKVVDLPHGAAGMSAQAFALRPHALDC